MRYSNFLVLFPPDNVPYTSSRFIQISGPPKYSDNRSHRSIGDAVSFGENRTRANPSSTLARASPIVSGSVVVVVVFTGALARATIPLLRVDRRFAHPKGTPRVDPSAPPRERAFAVVIGAYECVIFF
jgi:hypothetical protein